MEWFKRPVNVNYTKSFYKLRYHEGKIVSWIILLHLDRKMSLRPFIFLRFFLLITCISFTISMIWIQFVDKKYIIADSDLVQEAIENVARDYRYAEVYRKPDRLPKDLKYILLWSDREFAPFYYFGQGQRKFIEKNCSQINCYVTTNRNFFKGNITKFDAIAFNGRSMITKNKSHFPKSRSPHQKFIYFNMESADNYPVCSEYFDNFFNWTATYRLDSDIPFPYIQIRDLEGEVVGPKTKMKWIDMGILNDEELENQMQNKTKAVAWFVSHCTSRSRRGEYATQLQKALKPFGVSVDIYGQCGPFKCTRKKQDMCFSLLEKQYAFYLSFENSFAEDYVTEKLLTALQHNAVPIVLGGADYSRFLPPGSYIDAGKMTPKDLAAMIIRIMMNTKYYIQFFKWRSHYSYNDPSVTDNVCAVCEALNNEKKISTTSTYMNFRKWWNPRYKYRCKL